MKGIYELVDQLIELGHKSVEIKLVEDNKVELWSGSKYHGRWKKH